MSANLCTQRAAYKPMRKLGYDKYVAILTAFLASGILHDYCWTVLFYHPQASYDADGNCIRGDCYRSIFGKQTAFFLWCGVTMLLERPVGNWGPMPWMAKNLPLLVVSTLVVLTVLPFAHWYAGEWIRGGYFDAYSLGVFRITYENN
mmetsp:Transcript_29481/g.68212  ORF Transcript_29481/g.68212 Transcript_29481/m.68212 type:complete len:147 (-) Transcript_29481:306-746(-)